MPKVIKLKSYVDMTEELVAAAIITPGMLIERTSLNKVQAHSTSGRNAARMFAREDYLQGKDYDDQYAVGDQVQVMLPLAGEELLGILADGEDVAIGDFLESNGAGFLQKHTADIVEGGSSGEAIADVSIYTHQIVAQALEDVNISSSSGAESSGEGGSDPVIGYARRIKIKIV